MAVKCCARTLSAGKCRKKEYHIGIPFLIFEIFELDVEGVNGDVEFHDQQDQGDQHGDQTGSKKQLRHQDALQKDKHQAQDAEEETESPENLHVTDDLHPFT